MDRASLKRLIFAGLCFIALASCSPKNFFVENDGGAGQQGGPPPTAVICGPLLNELSTSLVLNVGDSNPSLNSHCVPAGANHVWSVTRSSTPVTINGLGGAVSNPDFKAAGPGTYFVGLEATAVGLTGFSLPSPLQIVVRNDTPGSPNVSCTPKINGSLTAYTTTTSTTSNPTISGNCVPPGGAYVWTVYKNGSPVTVPGLTGSASVGQFVETGEGVYQIWLAASLSGYNGFYSTTPLTVTVPPGATTGGPVHEVHAITSANKKLDILFIIDDSSSMLADNQHLASRLENFVNGLSANGLDWQACVTLTRAMQSDDPSDTNYYWGASAAWEGYSGANPYVLKSGTPNTFQIFTNTISGIGAGWLGTDDERGIKAAYWHLYNGDPSYPDASGCYRPEAGLAVILLSDEDERSVGGDDTQIFYSNEANKPLENDDLPSTYVSTVKQVFGNSKRFTFNSIIVRPGDTSCMATQDTGASKAHYGTKYYELSQLTGGHVGSICDADYSTNLTHIFTTIQTSQASVPLRCPSPAGAITIDVQPPYVYTSSVSSGRLEFTPELPAGSTVTLDYTCP